MDPREVEQSLRAGRPGGIGPVQSEWSGHLRRSLTWFGPSRIVGAVALTIVALVGGWWLLRSPAPSVERTLPMARGASGWHGSAATGEAVATTIPSGRLVVHVAGAVTRPGLVKVDAGARVADAIEAAGGALPEADLNALNLAAPAQDGTRVYVPMIGENPAGAGVGAVGQGKVDLNRSTDVQLDALPGVGPSLARAIVAYRAAHGSFHRVEDLLNVPGIGASKLALFHDLVTV